MRILLVNDYATATAGAERITLDLRDGLRARGHEVRVFASRAQLIAGESFADVTCYGTNTRVQTLTSTVNWSAARALRRELRSFAPDVVQARCSSGSSRRRSCPCCVPCRRCTGR
jgi:hypothetical protein